MWRRKGKEKEKENKTKGKREVKNGFEKKRKKKFEELGSNLKTRERLFITKEREKN